MREQLARTLFGTHASLFHQPGIGWENQGVRVREAWLRLADAALAFRAARDAALQCNCYPAADVHMHHCPRAKLFNRRTVA